MQYFSADGYQSLQANFLTLIMKLTLILILLMLSTSVIITAQNTGIGTLNPQRTLHVGGGMRIDTLAGAGNGFIKFDGNGDILRFPQSGNVLDVLRGDGSWGSAYQAGTGISIIGNTISATGTGLWVTDVNGINSQSSHVGINTQSDPLVPLTIRQNNTGVGNAVLHLKSDDVFHTGMSMFNNNIVNSHYSLLVGGPTNNSLYPGNFGIYNHSASVSGNPPFVLTATRNTNLIGIGSVEPGIPARSRLHVFNGDINIDQIGSGIIMKSSNGQCWRVTVTNAGTFNAAAIACP